jgi:hypothetical protein
MDPLAKANVETCGGRVLEEDGEWAGLFKAPKQNQGLATVTPGFAPISSMSLVERLSVSITVAHFGQS